MIVQPTMIISEEFKVVMIDTDTTLQVVPNFSQG